MAQVTIDEAMRIAIEHYQAGRMAAAEEVCGQIVAQRPNHAHPLHLLGVLAFLKGQTGVAIDLVGRAIAINPGNGEYHSNLGEFYRVSGQRDQAVASFRRAIERAPAHAEAHGNLGLTLYQLGRLDEAIAAYNRAIALKPELAGAQINLGVALRDHGRLDEAIAAFRRAIEISPDLSEAHNNLGVVLRDQGQVDLAIAAYDRAIALKPDYAEAHNNLGIALKEQCRPDLAIAALDRAIALKSDYAEAHNNLGNALKDEGQLDRALACFRKAADLNPVNAGVASSLVYSLHFHPDYDAAAILAEHRQWARRYADPLSDQIRAHPNDRSPDRRLRVGFLGRRYADGPQGQLIQPLFRNHDRGQYEFICYSDTPNPDAVTAELSGLVDEWHDASTLSDPQVCDRIRADRIDILVDLTMHVPPGNRMLVFARKPAPVQMTALEMITTTGLATMDYRLTDAYLDPPGETDGDYTERSIRLPRCFWCYQPPAEAPPVGELPAQRNGFVTFGCLNATLKMNRPTRELWAKVLQAVPTSRMIIHSTSVFHDEV